MAVIFFPRIGLRLFLSPLKNRYKSFLLSFGKLVIPMPATVVKEIGREEEDLKELYSKVKKYLFLP